jgi:hypothetical protein
MRHNTITSLLSSLRLSSYAARFVEEGHDDVSYLAAIAAGRYPLLKLSDVFADVGLSSPADQEAVRAALLASRPAEPPSPPPPDTSPPAAGTTLVTKQAEGLTLVLNEGSSTGYKGVRPKGDRFMAEIWEDGRNVSLGRYDTAVEAAVAYARHAAPKGGGAAAAAAARGATAAAAAPRPSAAAAASPRGKAVAPRGGAKLVKTVHGIELHLNEACSTGYKGVFPARNNRFEARAGKKKQYLGIFDTAVEAAEAYARHMLSQPTKAADEWRLDHKWVGKRVRREFDEGVFVGAIVGWDPEGMGPGAALFHVTFDDGDEEDLDVRQVEAGLQDEDGEDEAEAAEEEEAAVATHAPSGLKLHLSSSSTGYKGVERRGDRFVARVWSGTGHQHIGWYDTAVEAAEGYAKQVGPPEEEEEEEEALLPSSSRKGCSWAPRRRSRCSHRARTSRSKESRPPRRRTTRRRRRRRRRASCC